MKQNRLFTIAAILCFAASAALAGGPPQRPALLALIMAKYDTNGDGVLSDAEKSAMHAALAAERQAIIAKYDRDGDGALNETERTAMHVELEAARLAELAAKFAALDTDGDAALSLEEFAAGAPANASPERIQAAFTRMDTDGDGVISLAEFSARPKPHGGDKPHKGGGGNRGPASVAMTR